MGNGGVGVEETSQIEERACGEALRQKRGGPWGRRAESRGAVEWGEKKLARWAWGQGQASLS